MINKCERIETMQSTFSDYNRMKPESKTSEICEIKQLTTKWPMGQKRTYKGN